jgi:thiamine-phosphate pyrophosphorylase
MDAALCAWGRTRKGVALWFFTDERVADPAAVIARLPRGAGIVLRGAKNHAAAWAPLCRGRPAVTPEPGLPGLGVHLRGGRRTGRVSVPKKNRIVTASAHNMAELVRARRAGAGLVFISPVFVTASHPGGKTLGVFGWLRLARAAPRGRAAALGGVNGGNVRRLGRACAAIGAIDAFTR